MKHLCRLLLPFILVAFSLLAANLYAQQTLIDDKFTEQQHLAFEEVQGSVMSPYCPGRLLKDCPSTAARDLKFDIKSRILKGDSAGEIVEDLLKEFGEDMRAAPKVEGIGALAWIAPGVFLLIGFIAILLWVRSQQQSSSTESEKASAQ